MESIASRREFVAGAVAAGAALVATGAAHADETATGPDGYSFQETSTGLSVTVSDNEDPGLPTVVLLATGGTIAGTGDAGKTTGYSAGELDVASLLASVPGVEELANVRGVQVCNISSTEMTSAYWVQMAKTINELAEDETVSGFVVTHGTDTLDETAYFLHLACKTDKPVVVTGAMRPATATSADGPMNLYQSIALAASPEAMGRGTMVVFSDGIYCGRDVQKVSTFRCDAFNSKDMGFLGYIQDANVHFYNSSDRAHSTATEFDVSGIDELPKVGVLYSNVGADAELVDAMLGLGVKGIVLCGSGAGGTSQAIADKLGEASDAGVPVISCSRIANGLIDAYYDKLIPGDNLPPQKAAILLALALTVTADRDKIAEMVGKY